MTEITRVPLQPIKKGSLTKLWLGVIVAILLGAGLAWAAMPKGLDVETVTAGSGDSPKVGDVVFVNYVGKLPVPPGLFPEGNPLLLEEGAIIDGFVAGLQQMQKGGSYVLTIPADQAYGAEPPPGSPIPANADLVFEIDVIDFMSRDDFQARAAALQQMMGAEGEAGAGPPADE